METQQPTDARKLSQAKSLGGVGAILSLLSFIPNFGIIVVIVGIILILVAVNDIANYTHERSIFTNLVISDVLSIVGLVVGFLVVFAAVFKFIGLPSITTGTTPAYSDIVALVVGVIAGLLVVWICAIISAFFLKKSYDMVAAKLNVGLFRTAALLNLIGALTAIILIGFVIIFIAQILIVAAFFSIPDRPM